MDDDIDETEEETLVVDLDADELDDELEGDELVADELDDDELVEPELDVVDEVEVAEEEDEDTVPTRRAKPAGPGEEEEDDDEEADPDDVEEDLDTILRDRIAAGDDTDEEDEEEVAEKVDPESSDGVTARKEGEFTCTNCFMIVHPRQFGRKDRLTCPVGDDDCPSIAIVAKQRG